MNLRGAGISGIVRPHVSVPPFWHGIFISTEGCLMESRGLSREGNAISSIMREFYSGYAMSTSGGANAA